MPARGLRPKPDPGQPVEHWDVVFTCPACGLLTTFDIANLSPALLSSIHGTHWATQLRLYDRGAPLRALAHERQATGFNLFSVFVISFLTWLILTGSLDAVDLLWGAIASFVVARFSYRLVALDLPRWVFLPRRWPAFFSLLLAVTWQLVKQNIALSIRVLRPTLAVRPGIVAVPTMLRDDIALTLLGSLITLTPDTVTVDIDQRNGLIFVHWIDVKASAPEEVRALIAADFEEKLIRLLK
jgi:multicomponent Na+:H+ antiporter subunit E